MLLFVPWVTIGPDIIFNIFKRTLRPNPSDRVLALHKQGLLKTMNLNGKLADIRPNQSYQEETNIVQ